MTVSTPRPSRTIRAGDTLEIATDVRARIEDGVDGRMAEKDSLDEGQERDGTAGQERWEDDLAVGRKVGLQVEKPTEARLAR
jgi:hypothetical protein